MNILSLLRPCTFLDLSRSNSGFAQRNSFGGSGWGRRGWTGLGPKPSTVNQKSNVPSSGNPLVHGDQDGGLRYRQSETARIGQQLRRPPEQLNPFPASTKKNAPDRANPLAYGYEGSLFAFVPAVIRNNFVSVYFRSGKVEQGAESH